jgi:hypothetical protein
LNFKFRGADWHARKASDSGRRARAILLECSDPTVVFTVREEINMVDEVVKAAHHANIAITSREMSQAAVHQKTANLDAQRVRQMMTPRCDYQRASEEKLPDGSVLKVAGDPCGGKLKVKTRHRVFIGGECVTCGRFYPVPKDQEEAPADVAEAEASA